MSFDEKHTLHETSLVRKSGGTPLRYIANVVDEVIVTSTGTGVSGRGYLNNGNNNVLNFCKVTYNHWSLRAEDSVAADVTAGWDVVENIETIGEIAADS